MRLKTSQTAKSALFIFFSAIIAMCAIMGLAQYWPSPMAIPPGVVFIVLLAGISAFLRRFWESRYNAADSSR